MPTLYRLNGITFLSSSYQKTIRIFQRLYNGQNGVLKICKKQNSNTKLSNCRLCQSSHLEKLPKGSFHKTSHKIQVFEIHGISKRIPRQSWTSFWAIQRKLTKIWRTSTNKQFILLNSRSKLQRARYMHFYPAGNTPTATLNSQKTTKTISMIHSGSYNTGTLEQTKD